MESDVVLWSGLMFASLAWMEVAGALVGNVIQNAVFTATVGRIDNFVFIVNAGAYLLTALITTYVPEKCFFTV